MPIPQAPEDRNLPKGPNFLAIVIGIAVAILLILLASWAFLNHRKTVLPMNTKGTPSQTRNHPPLSPNLPAVIRHSV